MPTTQPMVSDDDPICAPAAPRRRRADVIVAVLALGLAVLVTSGLWLDPNGRAITVNTSDQALFEWLLAYGAHALSHGENPLFTHLINVPDGVNLAVNTSITVYAVVFAPLTYTIGPPATFLVILTCNLAATAYAWYWLLSRPLPGAGEGRPAGRPFVRSPLAAAVGGLFCGFAPSMISHANAHLNWTAGWLVPLIVWQVLRLREPGRALRRGIVLGVLVAIAFSIAAEWLFFIALACGVFLAARALSPAAWGEARRALPALLRGLAVTAVVAFTLLSYPLWLHFFGPQRFAGTGFDHRVHAEDVAAYGAFPARSLAGEAGFDTGLAPNPTEENSFFGFALPFLVLACLVLLWRHADAGRRATLRALTITAAVFTLLSFGPRVKWRGEIMDFPLPYALLGKLPVFNAALPARLALIVTPIIGVILALAVDRLVTGAPRPRWLSAAWAAGFAVALLPLAPVPLLTTAREPVPAFITSGAWRDYVAGDDPVIATVPLTLDLLPDGQRWQAHALAHRQGEFAIPSGFFLGPGGEDGKGRIGPVPRETDALLFAIGRSGVVPRITAANRAAARDDFRYWRTDVVVLADQVHGSKFPVHEEALQRATTQLLGPPERVMDVWLWRLPS